MKDRYTIVGALLQITAVPIFGLAYLAFPRCRGLGYQTRACLGYSQGFFSLPPIAHAHQMFVVSMILLGFAVAFLLIGSWLLRRGSGV
jgi:hypothetical protein